MQCRAYSIILFMYSEYLKCRKLRVITTVPISTTVLPCGKLVLNICIYLPKKHFNEFDTMTFKLVHDVQIVLLHMHKCRNQVIPYPYHVRWFLREMLYTLKVNRLEIISELISLNRVFNIRLISMQY